MWRSNITCSPSASSSCPDLIWKFRNVHMSHAVFQSFLISSVTHRLPERKLPALRMWLRADNYNSEAEVYLNDFFIYDPTNVNYQRLSQSFWDVYCTEQYGWRDQPLWAHFLDKLGMVPLPLSDKDIGLLKDGQNDGQKGFGKHGITAKYADDGMLTSGVSVSRKLDEREMGSAHVARKLAAEESIVRVYR